MWNWLKEHAQVVGLAISAIIGIASIALAFFAYQIDRSVQENAIQEARTSRSVAMAQGIFSDAIIRRLRGTTHRIEKRIDRSFDLSNDKSDQKFKELQLVELALYDSHFSFETDLEVLLLHARSAINCIEENLCDASTLLALSGALLADLFYMVRPTLKCSPWYSRTRLDYLYKLIKMHMERSFDGEVFMYYEDFRKYGQSLDERYVIIEFGPRELCNTYIEAVGQQQRGRDDSRSIRSSAGRLSSAPAGRRGR